MSCDIERKAEKKARDRLDKASAETQSWRSKVEAASSARTDGILEGVEGGFSANPAKVARGAQHASAANKALASAEAGLKTAIDAESAAATDWWKANQALEDCLKKPKPAAQYKLKATLTYKRTTTYADNELLAVDEGKLEFTGGTFSVPAHARVGDVFPVSVMSANGTGTHETTNSNRTNDAIARCTETWHAEDLRWNSTLRMKNEARLVVWNGSYVGAQQNIYYDRNCNFWIGLPPAFPSHGLVRPDLNVPLHEAMTEGLLMIELPERGKAIQKVPLNGAEWTIEVERIKT